MSKNILEALGKIDVALGGNDNDAVNVIDALDQISQGAGSLKTSVDNINEMQIKICDTDEYDAETGIPTIEDPDENIFYLTPVGQEKNGIFNEYYFKDGQWKLFGSANINVNNLFDLSDRMAKGVDDNGDVVNGAVIEGEIQGQYKNKASGLNSHAEGNGAIASGPVSHAEGSNTKASGECSHAEGRTNNPFSKTVNNITYTQAGAYGESSHSEGQNTLAIGGSSHAEGVTTTASGINSHAEGVGTTASGPQSHAEGGSTTASGPQSHTEGGSTTASGVNSHAEGGGTNAIGYSSHAEGNNTTASGQNSHAEGVGTTASGDNSHVEGAGTTASGSLSHAEGGGTTASGGCSHAEGYYTIANRQSQHVFGEYNIADTSENSAAANSRGNYIEIVGNGTNQIRSNARTLDWSGNETLSGSLSLAGSLIIGKGTADEVTITAAQLKSLIALLNKNN